MWWLPLLAVPLTNGAPDDADPAVVAIVRADTGAAHCSGVVISERVVLTAAHCGIQVDPSAYRVFVGNQVGAPGDTIEIVEAVGHPTFDGTEAHDVALVLLARSSLVPPVPTFADAPPSLLRLVGFGDTDGSALDGGRKRSGTTMVSSTTPLSVVLDPSPSLPCSGDSGGPAFAAGGEVAAIVSRGDPSCATFGKATRVDAHLAFITPYVEQTAPGTIELGDRCKYDDHCVSGSCVTAFDEPLLQYCSTSCSDSDDCPDAMECDGHACRFPVPSPGAIGATCATDDVCVRGECIDAGYCSVRCVSGRDDCPADYECTHLGGVDFFCTPAPASGGCCDAGGDAGSGLLGLGLVLLVSRGRRRSNRCR